MPKRAPPSTPAEPVSYEAALAELERLLQSIEQAQLPLDQLLDSHRRAGVLLQFCRSKLDAVEQQVKVLDEGQLKPWDHNA
jgi:exodeoxyribonuclease VII small subunit